MGQCSTSSQILLERIDQKLDVQNQQLNAQNQQLNAQNQQLDSQFEQLEALQKQLNKANWEKKFRKLCPWLEMATTNRSRIKNLINKIKIRLGEETLKCAVSGLAFSLKVAHIIPDSAPREISKLLGLPPDFKNSLNFQKTNFLVLDSAIEEAFDAMQLSFVPRDTLHPLTLSLKVWDPICLETSLASDSNYKIKNFVDERINIPKNLECSFRCLSYQAICAYTFQNTLKNNNYHIQVPDPFDFSTQNNDAKDAVRHRLVEMIQTYFRLEFEQEDDDDDQSIHPNFELFDTLATYIPAPMGDNGREKKVKGEEKRKAEYSFLVDGDSSTSYLANGVSSEPDEINRVFQTEDHKNMENDEIEEEDRKSQKPSNNLDDISSDSSNAPRPPHAKGSIFVSFPMATNTNKPLNSQFPSSHAPPYVNDRPDLEIVTEIDPANSLNPSDKCAHLAVEEKPQDLKSPSSPPSPSY